MNILKQHTKKFLILIIACVMLVAVFSTSYALPIINIDTFDDVTNPPVPGPEHQIHIIPTGPGGNNPVPPTCGTPWSDTSMMGMVRDISLERVSGNGEIRADVNSTVTGAFAFSVNASTAGTAIIQWDGTPGCTLNPTGLGGQPLNPNDGLFIYLQRADQGVTIQMRIYTNATDFSVYDYILPYPVNSPGHVLFFPFDRFIPDMGGSGADFNAVGAIEIEISGSELDMTIDIVASDFARDYGDLPSDYNNTTINNLPLDVGDDGARHILGGIHFGSIVDSELNGQESIPADGDIVRSDDEDGISMGSDNNWGDSSGSLDIVVERAGSTFVCVVGFIDWDNSNSFDPVPTVGSVSEIVYSNWVFQDNLPISFTSPNASDYPGGVYPPELYSRFRVFVPNDPIFTAAGLTLDVFGCPIAGSAPTDLIKLVYGDAVDGEVEDDRWAFTPTAVNLQTFSADNNPSTLPMIGVAVVMVLAIVSVGLFFVGRKQNES